MGLGLGFGLFVGSTNAPSSSSGLGPELLTNGTFSSAGPPPTIYTNVAISGGVATCAGASQIASWTGVTTVGQTYRAQLDYTCTSGASVRIDNSSTDGGDTKDTKAMTVDGALHTIVFADFVATGTDFSIGAVAAIINGTFDNVSLKKVG